MGTISSALQVWVQLQTCTVESGYQAHIRYLAHTAYQAHAVLLTKFVQTLDKKRTAHIRQKFGVGDAKSQVEQAREGSANEDHFRI